MSSHHPVESVHGAAELGGLGACVRDDLTEGGEDIPATCGMGEDKVARTYLPHVI
jgi:hypothetical protein